MTVSEQLQMIMRETFDDQAINISNEMTAADVDAWDSLSHIELIVNIEDSFNIKLSVNEIINLQNVGDMINLLEQKVSAIA